MGNKVDAQIKDKIAQIEAMKAAKAAQEAKQKADEAAAIKSKEDKAAAAQAQIVQRTKDVAEQQKGAIAAGVEASKAELQGGMMYAEAQMAPWQKAGTDALGKYQEALGMGPGGAEAVQGILEQLPGYQFRLSQGLQASTRMGAAGGRTLSGGQMKELQRTGEGLASQEYGNYLQNLTGMMGMGFQASTNLSNIGTSMSQTMAQTRMMGATATSGIMGNQVGLEAGFSQGEIGFAQQQWSTLQGQQFQMQMEQMRAAAAEQQARAMADASKSASIWGAVGTIGGAVLGGPAGAAIGGKIASYMG